MTHGTKPCAVTGKPTVASELTALHLIRPKLAALIAREHPSVGPNDLVSTDAINDAREAYVRELLATEIGELSHLEEEVVRSLRNHELLAENTEEEPKYAASFGQRLSDRISEFGGSWRFIISFGLVLVVWMAVNAFLLGHRAFDPYPFILLNLVLSTIAALQAPVIMMSQRRQEERDRRRAQKDYQINLKAELEIRHLHEKMDYLLQKNSERMLEIQQIQVDLMREIVDAKGTRPQAP